MPRIQLLHISDLHMRGSRERDRWRRVRVLGDAWNRNIEQLQEDGPVDLVCFTGDAAHSGKTDEFKESTEFLLNLLDKLRLPQTRLFLVPGNHDIDRSIEPNAWSQIRIAARYADRISFSNWLQGKETPPGFQDAWRDAVLSRQAAYRTWLSTDLARQDLLPTNSGHGFVGFRSTVEFDSIATPLHVIGLDTAWLAGDDNDPQNLRLTEDQAMRLVTDENGMPLEGIRLVLMHHPVTDLADKASSLRLLCDRADLVLRGHMHEVELSTWSDPDRTLRQIAAGCLYDVARGDNYPNSCNLVSIELDDDYRIAEIDVRFRGWSPNGFWYDDNGLYIDSSNGRLAFLVKDRLPPRNTADSKPTVREPSFVHPYAMQKGFTGRGSERLVLSEWFEHSTTQPLMLITGIGGLGKSALAWFWTLNDVLSNRSRATSDAVVPAKNSGETVLEGIMWWSFYETNAHFGAFVDAALAYAPPYEEHPKVAKTKADRLRWVLQKHRLLIILDGFERELRAYASLSAAFQDDTVADQITEPLRRITDPEAADFFREIARLPGFKSKILVTTRLVPSDIENSSAVCTCDLDGLALTDAIDFLRAQGIAGTDAEMEVACLAYGSHPLALRLLAGVVVNDRRHPRQIRAANRHRVTEDLRGPNKHHILAAAYEALQPALRNCLSTLAAFRSPVEFDVFRSIVGDMGFSDLGEVFGEFLERGLLYISDGKYDFHPIVRQYAYDRLLDKHGTHTHLLNYFSTAPAPNVPQDGRQMEPVVELYYHTCRAGRYDDAVALLRDRLFQTMCFNFGQYLSLLSLAGELLDDGEMGRPKPARHEDQAWVLGVFARLYSYTGRSQRAIECQVEANKIYSRPADKGLGAGQLVRDYLLLGMLAKAHEMAEWWLNLACDAGDRLQEALAQKAKASNSVYRGNFREANWRLEAAIQTFRNDDLRPLLADAYSGEADHDSGLMAINIPV